MTLIYLNKKFCQKIKELYDGYMRVSKRYSMDEDLLDRKITSNSHTKDEAYFKATLINSFYSTRMGADYVFAAANKISDENELLTQIIDKGINEDDEDTWTKLDRFFTKMPKEKINEEKGNKADNYHPYSFFTKYLAIHRRILKQKHDLPIYDSFVEKIIKHSDLYHEKEFTEYLKEHGCAKNFKHYDTLYWTIKYFAKELTEGNFTDLDHILWLLGKTIYGGGKTLDDFNSNKDIEDAIKESIGSAE